MGNWETINRLANIAQLVDFQMNIQQLSNDDLMEHLVKQDEILDKQINTYLKKIVEQNEEILMYLRKEK